MGVFYFEDKELPEYTTADADKLLKIDSNGVFLEWLQQTSELPVQTGNSGRFLTTNGTTASWAAISTIPSQTSQSGRFLTTNGSAASWAAIRQVPTGGTSGQFLRQDSSWQTISQVPSQTSQSGNFLTTNGTAASWAAIRQVPTGGTSGWLLRSDGANPVWTNTPSINSLTTSQNITCGGTVQANILTASNTVRCTSSATNQANIVLGNNIGTGIGCALGDVNTTARYVNIWVNDAESHTSVAERFRVNGAGEALLMNGTVLKGDGENSGSFSFANGTTPTVTSLNISNQGGPTGPSLTFGDLAGVTGNTGPSGIYANPVDNHLNFCTNGVERFKIIDGGIQTTGYAVANGPVVGAYIASNTPGTAIGQGIRLRNDAYFRHQGIYSSDIGHINFSTTQDGATGATASERMRINDSGISVTGNISATGNILGSFSPNPLNVTGAPRLTHRVIDALTWTVNENIEPVLIMTRSTTTTNNAKLIVPSPSTLPSGLNFRLYLFNLPGRFTTFTNNAELEFTTSNNNALLFNTANDIKYFVGNQTYNFATSTVTFTVLDFYNLRDYEVVDGTPRSRWLVTPVSKWVEPSPATTIWAGNN